MELLIVGIVTGLFFGLLAWVADWFQDTEEGQAIIEHWNEKQ